MNRDEHLAWAKRRALEYLAAGELMEAFTSMASDLNKRLFGFECASFKVQEISQEHTVTKSDFSVPVLGGLHGYC